MKERLPEDELPVPTTPGLWPVPARAGESGCENRTTRVGGLHPGSGSGARFVVSSGT